ncbi:hypothetical protein [Gemmatimonas sp.]|uniref:hypothetical protein n=1 Tax=Gemmatimonas sp. TaxID=1962908 RepID=UPI0025C10E0C|nr:hypothetical protein [Gemmatimonas sp.]MCA2991578.1 hypothetical protein [Gemmatimonas sp.]
MILANTRARLQRADAQLAVRLVARARGIPAERVEHCLADEGLDAVLDDPVLPPALRREPDAAAASLPLFSYVMVRHALRDTGADDRPLADYVASILLHFGLRQRARQLGAHDDATYDTLAAIADELDAADAPRAFLARAHLGNYALWLSGLFPDHIEQRRWRRGGPDLRYFESMGQRGFRLAADHRLAHEHGLGPVLATAAEQFGVVRVALNQVSDRLLFPHVHTPERLMRQVRDLFPRDVRPES